MCVCEQTASLSSIYAKQQTLSSRDWLARCLQRGEEEENRLNIHTKINFVCVCEWNNILNRVQRALCAYFSSPQSVKIQQYEWMISPHRIGCRFRWATNRTFKQFVMCQLVSCLKCCTAGDFKTVRLTCYQYHVGELLFQYSNYRSSCNPF